MNDIVLGLFNRNLDNKYRIIIPKIAGVEENEELVIILNDDYFEIKELKTVITNLKNIKAKIDNATNSKDIEFYCNLKNEITSCISGTITRDSQGRIIIGKYVAEKYDLKKDVIIEGVMDGLRVWNPDKFNQHQESMMKRNVRK